MIDRLALPYPAPKGEEPRNAYVYVPEGFPEDTFFPVLYMFDGHNVFFDEDATYGKSWGMKEFLEENGIPLIVAALECSHDPNAGRLSEYTPFPFDAKRFGGHVPAYGKETMDWYTQVFKPLIDSRYPTVPDREHTFLAGSSMGGLMTVYGVMAYNKVFGGGAALSPSVWVDKKKVLSLIRESEISPRTMLYTDMGDREWLARYNTRRRYGTFLRALTEAGVTLTARIVPGGEHCEASWEKQIPYFIDAVFDAMKAWEQDGDTLL